MVMAGNGSFGGCDYYGYSGEEIILKTEDATTGTMIIMAMSLYRNRSHGSNKQNQKYQNVHFKLNRNNQALVFFILVSIEIERWGGSGGYEDSFLMSCSFQNLQLDR